MKKIKAGLFGLGVVGSGVYQAIKADENSPISIEKIAVKNPRKERGFAVDRLLIHTDADDLLNDATLDVIIELINDPHEAFEIVSKALKTGKQVVTANKKMISLYHKELLQLRKAHNGTLLYEAAVCGSIPIIRLLDQQFKTDEIKQISTIANGTCNYILTQMSAKEWSYDKALAEAQALGFAELDPYSDVSGEDTRYKLSILILHSFGIHIAAENIPMIGIQSISSEAINFAKNIGAAIKLIGKAELINGNLTASVIPEFVTELDDFAHVHQEYNAVKLDAKYAGEQFFKGKGAGSLPTSSAVLSNLSDISRGVNYHFPNHQQTLNEAETEYDTFFVSGEEAFLDRLYSSTVLWQEKGSRIIQAPLSEVEKTINGASTFTCIRMPENVLKKIANTSVLV